MKEQFKYNKDDQETKKIKKHQIEESAKWRVPNMFAQRGSARKDVSPSPRVKLGKEHSYWRAIIDFSFAKYF